MQSIFHAGFLFLHFDFGGGTLDVAVVRNSGRGFEVLGDGVHVDGPWLRLPPLSMGWYVDELDGGVQPPALPPDVHVPVPSGHLSQNSDTAS